MNEDGLEELSSEALAALAEERTTPGLSAEARARVFAQLTASLEALQVEGAPTGAAEAPLPAAKGLFGITAKASLAAAFVLGGAGGYAAKSLLPDSAVNAKPDIVQLPVSSVPAGVDAGQSGPVEVLPDETLVDERALVEMARSALARRRPGDAAAALALHRKRYERGALAEERDALDLQLLLERGLPAQAATALQHFEARYPESLLSGSLRDAVREAEMSEHR